MDNFNFQLLEHTRIRQACESIDAQMQEAITNALNEVGIEFTDLQSIAHDCEFRIYPDKREVFCYKGRELLEFFPIEYKTIQKELSYFFTLEQKVRKLY